MKKPLQEKEFDLKKSPIREVYILLRARNPKELYDRYFIKDQKLIKRGALDYENPKLITTRVKDCLEEISPVKLSEEEKKCRQDILWLWYHHAISYAIWHYTDKKKARRYSLKALKYQGKDHPNKITRLFYFLTRDKLSKAEKLIKSMKRCPDKSVAMKLVKFYKEGGYYKK